MSGDTPGEPFDVKLDWGKGPFAVSPKRRALHDQIIAHPRDDSLRHVYADLAIEEGDPRGEYVRLALQRDALDEHGDADERRAIQYAMDHLFGRYARSIRSEWTTSDELAWTHARVELVERGGFIDRVHLDATLKADGLATRLDKIGSDVLHRCVAVAPITQIQMGLAGATAAIDMILEHAHVEHWQRRGELVALTRVPIATEDSKAFLVSRADEIEDVRVTFGPQLRPAERERVIAKVAATFPNLRRAWVGHGSLAGLHQLGALPRLERLSIAGQLTRKVGQRMLGAGFPSLRELILEKKSRADPRSLATLVKHFKVTRLVVQGDYPSRFSLNDESIRALDGAALRELVLRRMDVSASHARAFGAIALPRLQTLRIGYGSFAPELFEGAVARNVTTFELLTPELDVSTMERLSRALPSASELTLAAITPSAARVFAASALHQRIGRLSLGRLEPEALVAILRNANSLHELRATLPQSSRTSELIHALEDAGPLHALHLELDADEAVAAYLRSRAPRSLRRLRLSRAGPEVLDALVASPHLHELARLHVPFPGTEHGARRRRLVSRFGPRLKTGQANRSRFEDAPPDLDPWVN